MAMQLRAARSDDAPFVAQVLPWAARGPLSRSPWDLALPDASEREAVLARLASGGHASWCHHSLFHVAEVDGVVGSALCAFSPRGVGDVSLSRPLGAAFEAAGIGADRIAAARRAYEKAGFRVVEERKHPASEPMLGAPGVSRLMVAL